MTIEEAGPNPDRLAAAIHAQLGQTRGAVPLHAIAEALDIIEIRTARLKRLEGALYYATRPKRRLDLVERHVHS